MGNHFEHSHKPQKQKRTKQFKITRAPKRALPAKPDNSDNKQPPSRPEMFHPIKRPQNDHVIGQFTYEQTRNEITCRPNNNADKIDKAAFDTTNHYRTKKIALSALKWDETLSDIAMKHSEFMAKS